LHIRADVHDREIDIVQRETEDLESIFFAIGRDFAVRSSAGKIFLAVSYQENIPFHNL